MGEIFSDCTTYDSTLSSGIKEIHIVTPDTADDTDTIDIALADFGIKTFLYAEGWIQTTADSVVAAEHPTTAVSSGTLTLTITGSTDNKVRVYKVRGLS